MVGRRRSPLTLLSHVQAGTTPSQSSRPDYTILAPTLPSRPRAVLGVEKIKILFSFPLMQGS